MEGAQDENISLSGKLLNTEGCSVAADDDAFLDDIVEKLYNSYKVPLENAGFVGTVNDLLKQWHVILAYTVKYLNPMIVDYRKVWYQLFSSGRSKEWSLVLLLKELLFCLPISNVKVERLFSLMGRIKTDSRSSLGETRLNSLIRIVMEGPTLETFDAAAAMELWVNDSVRRPNQKPHCHSHTYTERKKKDRAITLTDLDINKGYETSDTEEQ